MNSGLDFSTALRELRKGRKICRESWNSTGAFCWLREPVDLDATWCRDKALKSLAELHGGSIAGSPTICLCKYTDGDIPVIQYGWTPSQEDLFAPDWQLVYEV